MRFSKNSFFIGLLCAVGTVFFPEYGYSKSDVCSKGAFLFSQECYTCRPGCYCYGGGDTTYSFDPYNKIYVSEFEQWCKDGTTCKKGKEEYKTDCGRAAEAKVARCPNAYPTSDWGASSSSDCYVNCGSTKIYNQKKSCSNGQYIPKGTNNCSPCPNDGKSYCTGVTNYSPSCSGADSNKGLHTCGKDEVLNSTGTGCVEEKKCLPGEYLPANSTECAACPAGSFCPDGPTIKKASINQGIRECGGEKEWSKVGAYECSRCGEGEKANEDHTACVDADNITVNPGYYLRANSVVPIKCTAKTKFCPGGMYGKGTTDRGIFDCPYSGYANTEHTGCVLDLTKEQLKYGVFGVDGNTISQCWVKTDPEDFKACVYGIRIQAVDEEKKEESQSE